MEFKQRRSDNTAQFVITIKTDRSSDVLFTGRWARLVWAVRLDWLYSWTRLRSRCRVKIHTSNVLTVSEQSATPSCCPINAFRPTTSSGPTYAFESGYGKSRQRYDVSDVLVYRVAPKK